MRPIPTRQNSINSGRVSARNKLCQRYDASYIEDERARRRKSGLQTPRQRLVFNCHRRRKHSDHKSTNYEKEKSK